MKSNPPHLTLAIWCLLLSAYCFGVEQAPTGAETPNDTASAATLLVSNYCLDCHSKADPAGELDLTDLPSLDHEAAKTESIKWEKIIKRLRARQMPPADAERPTEQEYVDALSTIETALDQVAASAPQPGRTEAVRRLNRTEYQNAIRDLLAIDVDAESMLPADQSGHGFDNVTVGELSPVLLSRYIKAAQQISRLAVGGPQSNPGGKIVRLPADRTQESHVAGLPFGTRGGTLFEHHFPLDGTYEIQLRLMRDRDEHIEGLYERHNIDVLIDRELAHRFEVKPPKTKPGWQKDDTLIDAHLVKRIQVTAGPHRVGVTFPNKSSSLSEIRRQPFHANFNRHRHPRKTPAIYEVSIVGPFDAKGPGDTPSRRKVFGDATIELRSGARLNPNAPNARSDAHEVLHRIIRLAYRRPPTDDDFVIPMQFFDSVYDSAGYEAGIETAISTILVNPHFLFRAESPPSDAAEGAVYQISDIELASRLSFFLWSSIPDNELLELAENDALHEPKVLQRQVERMLRDPRAESLVTNFAAQWLHLRNLKSFIPDRRLFPDFDDNLREALRLETESLFASVLHDDRSVLDLIRSDTTFLNERLAKHYDIPQVVGSHFRPVKVNGTTPNTTETHRGGILRHGSVLAVTSYATRTSPTIRGNWILENILGMPAPPPPPNIPSLVDKTAASAVTIRERLAEHRANPSCASCHDLMDPLGFALENYDAVGRWRVFDQGEPIDSAGKLPDGTEISSLSELEAGIVDRPELFVGTMAEKLLTFALGRGVEPFDGPAIRKVVRESADKDYKFSSLIVGIVSSTPFQMRVAAE